MFKLRTIASWGYPLSVEPRGADPEIGSVIMLGNFFSVLQQMLYQNRRY